ncbi:hypothetical protein [Ralstonia chuxiongensis]|uniref:Uncharacterized protein n=1 Tax=Ralstonia chuxiongensis TaxID=2957504 RepID=A0AA42BJX1_9RALS|nr:hypothetical protein [Ralstonia chuxiongensis]MCP1175649.1 hypothetical protein [Ralstonia chuxiongensis]
MSQHYFETTYLNRPVRVMIGWDRPVQQYLLTVEYLDADRYVYTNLQERKPFAFELEDYRSKLQTLGIDVPASMFNEVQQDRARNMRERYVYYKADGTYTEHFMGPAPAGVEQRRGLPFKLGDAIMTTGVFDYMNQHGLLGVVPAMLVARHAMGDWGDVCEEDRNSNNLALEEGRRIMSSYMVGSRKIWVITEADRSVTTLLFPDEY